MEDRLNMYTGSSLWTRQLPSQLQATTVPEAQKHRFCNSNFGQIFAILKLV